MKWLSSAFLLVPAIAFAQTTPTESTSTGETIQETVIVKALPPGPSDTPKKPSMQLHLDSSFSFDSADFTFPSGLRVIMQEDHSEPLIGITMWVDRGSSSDPIGKEGIAHYVEHLWFKSKHGEGIPMVWDLLDEMGCYLNASTSNDWTNYMTVCPAEFTGVMLKLESLRLNKTLEGVTPEEMLTEREVVRNELRLRMEVGGGELFRYLMMDVYPEGHPYNRETIGTHESLTNIELPDIQAFVDANYGPANTTLVIVGDFDREEALSLLIENFDVKNIDPRATEDDVFRYPRPGVEHPDRNNPDHWFYGLWDVEARGDKMVSFEGTPPQRAKDKALPPPKPSQQENFHEAPIRYPTVGVSWAVPGSYQGDDIKWNLIANLLIGQLDFYFEEDARVRTDRITKQKQFGCYYLANTVNGSIICIVELSGSKVDGAKVGWDVVDQVAGIYSFDPTLLERPWGQARMRYMADVLLSMDVVAALDGRAFDIAEWAHYTGSPTYHSDAIRASSTGSVLEAQRATYEYLTRQQAVISVITPLPSDQIQTDSSEQAWHGAGRESDIVKHTAVDLTKVDNDYIISQTHIPDLGTLHEATFDNGLRVWVLPHGEVPLVNARLVFGGGGVSDSDGRFTFAEVFSTHDAYSNIELEPLQFAGEFTEGAVQNYRTFSVKSSSENLDSGLWTLREVVRSIRPDTSAKSTWFKRQKSSLVASWLDDDPQWFIDRITADHWNPGHAATKTLMFPDYEQMAELGTPDSDEMLDRVYQPANATLIIVGRIDPEAAMELAETYFDGWRANPGTAVGPYGVMMPPNASEAGRVVLFDRPAKTQTAVEFTCQVGPWDNKNLAPINMAGTILDQNAFKILREQLGTTYGAGAGVATYEGGSAYLYMSTSVQNSATGTAVATFLDMVRQLEKGEIDPEQLTMQKLHTARAYGLGQQSLDQMTTRLTGASRNGLDLVRTYGERLAAIDAASVSAAVQGCDERALITVAGPKETIAPLLDQEGIAYEIYDWRAEGDALVQQYDPKGWKKELKKRAAKEDEEPQAAAPSSSGGAGTP